MSVSDLGSDVLHRVLCGKIIPKTYLEESYEESSRKSPSAEAKLRDVALMRAKRCVEGIRAQERVEMTLGKRMEEIKSGRWVRNAAKEEKNKREDKRVQEAVEISRRMRELAEAHGGTIRPPYRIPTQTYLLLFIIGSPGLIRSSKTSFKNAHGRTLAAGIKRKRLE